MSSTRRTRLSDRELDVLELALLGLTHQQIGDRLFLSVDTVKTHFRRIYLHLHDDLGRPASGALNAVAVALERGELDFDDRSRRVVRPPGRRPLPVYSSDDALTLEPALSGGRSPRDRRAALGW